MKSFASNSHLDQKRPNKKVKFNEKELPNSAQNEGKFILWKIAKEGCPDSYLFGTCHLPSEKNAKFKPEETQAFLNCSRVVTELDMNTDPAVINEIMSKSPLHLEFFDKVVSFMKNYSNSNDETPIDEVLSKKIEETREAFYQSEKLIAKEALSLDMRVQNAITNQKHVPLETLQMQLEEIDKNPKLGKSILGRGTYNEVIGTPLERLLVEDNYVNAEMFLNLIDIMNLYDTQDIEKLEECCVAFQKKDIDSYNNVSVRRNETWLPALLDLMSKESCFIAVGMLHLYGEKGLIDLFRQNGFTLTATTYPMEPEKANENDEQVSISMLLDEIAAPLEQPANNKLFVVNFEAKKAEDISALQAQAKQKDQAQEQQGMKKRRSSILEPLWF